MSMGTHLPEIVGEIPGITDEAGLRQDIASLKGQLAATGAQMAFERQLAMDVHRARSIAIIGNPTMSLIFEVEDTDTTRVKSHTTEEMLSAAFLIEGEQAQLPEGFAKHVAKKLRIESHPDHGHDASEASTIAGYLEDEEADPSFSIAGALATRQTSLTATLQELRDERYHLTVALSGSKPRFRGEDEARRHAETEIEGTEWRVRTQAALKCFELIIGSGEIWNRFLQRIAQEQHMPTIEMVNRNQPVILALQERIVLGDPIKLDDEAKQEIDETLERIWTTLNKKDDSLLPYSPPYGNWLPILLPVMQRLDPGKKPSVEYTYFEPPFRVQQAPRPRYPDFRDRLPTEDDKSSIFRSLIKEDLYYNNVKNDPYGYKKY